MQRIIGYIRNINGLENVQSQLDLLKAAGATEIFHEKPAITKCNTPVLDKLMADVKAGDTVVITSLDRITHNTKHLLGVVDSLNAAGASLRVIDSGIDTSTTNGELVRKVLAAIVALERQVVHERQAAGIAKAKQEGRYKGRKPTAMAKTNEVLSLKAQGLTRQKIADQLGIGVASVYRILKNQSTSDKKQSKKSKNSVDKQIQAKNKITHETKPATKGEQLSFF